ATFQSLLRRARTPRSYSLSALGVAVGCRTWSTAGLLLGSAGAEGGRSARAASRKPIRAFGRVGSTPPAHPSGPRPRTARGGARAVGEECGDGLEIGFGGDADRRLRRLDDDDVDPVLEEPELLELLGELERRLRQTMEGVERRLAIGVEALMLEAHRADAVAIVGDRVLREVKPAAVHAPAHLLHVRVRGLVRSELDLERAHLRGRALAERADEKPDVLRRQ